MTLEETKGNVGYPQNETPEWQQWRATHEFDEDANRAGQYPWTQTTSASEEEGEEGDEDS